jgi:NAD-dependent SIR2 family protein deacetylase
MKSEAKFPANLDVLATAIRQRRLILFVGGGISQSLGLPDFRELVEHLALELGFDTDRVTVSDYPVVAEAYFAKHGKLGALRSWMDMTWHPATIDISESEIHNLILDLDFPIIYTTNYDRWLEFAFEARGKPYHKIVSIADLADFEIKGTEIIKFHGDFEDDDSLVLTETSYFQRMSFESPLDIRLRADCLARPILFIGYSLHDVNTRYLLFRLQELWKNTAYSEQRPKSFIFMVEEDPAQAMVLESRGIEPILAQQSDPRESSRAFLEELVSRVKRSR